MAEDHDDDAAPAEVAAMFVRCCEHGTIWLDTVRPDGRTSSIGFSVETAMDLSDALITNIGEAIEILKAGVPCAGSA